MTRDAPSGSDISGFEFDEYGNLLSPSGSGTASPKTWIGGLSVNDDRARSGMFNMGHRNYSGGVLGRFISRDPIGHSGGLNLYSYTSNPVRYVDPSGLTCKIQGKQNDIDFIVDQLEKATGFDLLEKGGIITINPNAKVRTSGTSGSARQLLQDIIGSNDVINYWATDTGTFQSVTDSQRIPAGKPRLNVGQAAAGVFGGTQSLLVDNIQAVLSQNSTIARAQLIHEIAEAFQHQSKIKGAPFNPCHGWAVTAENQFLADVSSSLRRRGQQLLKGPNNNVIGATIDYSSATFTQIDGNYQAGTFTVR